MKVTRLKERETEILKRLSSKPRMEGQHMTAAIYCNVKAWAEARLGAANHDVRHNEATLLRFLRGQWREAILSEGEMAQIQTISREDASVGTIDIWRACAVETKSTAMSVNKDIGSVDHWMLQLGGYVARNIKDGAKTAKGELWVIHEDGDCGKKYCPEHGYPETEFKRKHPDTKRQRLACPVDGCWAFLTDGRREPMLRCYEVRWTREELEGIHELITRRLADIETDIENADYAIGSPPPIRHGYDFECRDCSFKEMVGCLGRGPTDDMEEKLEGSILELEEKELATT